LCWRSTPWPRREPPLSLRACGDPREVANRWRLHHHIVLLLKAPDQVVGHELRHQIIAVPEPAAAIALKREAQRETKLIRIGGRQLGRVFGHGGRLVRPFEQIKNSQASGACRERVCIGEGKPHGTPACWHSAWDR
jgi:hypothetical protein